MIGSHSLWALYGHTLEAVILNIYNSPVVISNDRGWHQTAVRWREWFLLRLLSLSSSWLWNKHIGECVCVCVWSWIWLNQELRLWFKYFTWIHQKVGGNKRSQKTMWPISGDCCILTLVTKWKLRESEVTPECLPSAFNIRKHIEPRLI